MVNCRDNLQAFTAREEDFSRKRKIPLEHLVGALLHKSLASPGRGYELIYASFRSAIGRSDQICRVNRSSFCEAREKLSWEAFAYLLGEVSLEEEPNLPKWKSHRVRAIDGSFLQLPSSPEILKTFPVRGGGFGDSFYPYAKLFLSANIMTGQITHTSIGNYHSGERASLMDFIAQFERGDVAILDRGMIGKKVWRAFDEAGQFYVGRLKVRANNFYSKAKKDQIVCLKDQGHPLRVRVVRGPKLATGEYVFLATNLIDLKRYSRKDLLEIYRQRQAVEDVFLNLKTKLNVKNIRSKKINGVLQEIYAALTMTSLVAGLRFIFEQKQTLRRRVSFKALCWRTCQAFYAIVRPTERRDRLFRDMIYFGHVRQRGRKYPRHSQQPPSKWIKERRNKKYRARKRSMAA